MNRERIKHQGIEPMNGNDAYTVLGIVFDFLDENSLPMIRATEGVQMTGDLKELLHRLREAGYCACETEFGCAACGGSK